MKELEKLDLAQRSILLASILGDGEITKIYKNSRRKNHSYREHYGIQQKGYREWKVENLPELLYITCKSNTVRSKFHCLFTNLYPYFYSADGKKHIPLELLLKHSTSIYFLIVLYLDDGSLIISKRVNHRKKLIYISPSIAFYLQCYIKEELEELKDFIFRMFNIPLTLNKRNDGEGYILKMNKTIDVYYFLNEINKRLNSIECMRYKMDWNYRLNKEIENFNVTHLGYQVIQSDSTRFRNYNEDEITTIIRLKRGGKSDSEIANTIGRTYWSVVYKIRELRNNDLL